MATKQSDFETRIRERVREAFDEEVRVRTFESNGRVEVRITPVGLVADLDDEDLAVSHHGDFRLTVQPSE